jgi:ribonuclease HII
MIRAGIDEAGRGPIVGPMVLAICGLTEEKAEQMRRAGMKDSKLILPLKREELASVIKSNADFLETIEFSPQEIDDAVNNPDINLNGLEAKGTAILLSKFWDKHPDSMVAIDLPSNNLAQYRDRVISFLPEEHKSRARARLILEHKADSTYVEASCASIMAKTIRDMRVREIEKEIGTMIGSGYPADPRTISFLKTLNSVAEKHIRKSWASYKRLLRDKGQTKLK